MTYKENLLNHRNAYIFPHPYLAFPVILNRRMRDNTRIYYHDMSYIQTFPNPHRSSIRELPFLDISNMYCPEPQRPLFIF